MLLSKYQAEKLFTAHRYKFSKCKTSLDLGINETELTIDEDIFLFPDGQKLTLQDIKKIIKNDTSVFFIEEDSIHKVQLFSPDTNKFYKLMPTGYDTPPTLEISGIRMHIVKEMDPWKDTINKIKCIEPIRGIVLDCNMGLGYTATLASKNADKVITCEIDPNVIEIAKWNPYSKELFSGKIEVRNNDVFNEIKNFPDSYFDRIIHDPPSFMLAQHLYSVEFYKEMRRVLKNDGIIYHYVGMPGHKRGINIQANVKKKLVLAGFKNMVEKHRGLVVKKQ